MSTKKKTSIEKADFFLSTDFCTECGESLANYALQKNSSDEKIARAKQNECKKNGKFKGDVCSKLFIASNDESENPQISDLPANSSGDEF